MKSSPRHQITTNLSERFDSGDDALQLQVQTRANTSFAIQPQDNYDRLVKPFMLPHNVVIAPGSYTWSSGLVHVRTSTALPFSFHVDAWCCDYYNGSQWRMRNELFFKPSETYELEADYDTAFIRTPGGKEDIQILALNGILNFTPEMQFALQAQYDNISQGFGVLGHYRWEFQPGSEIFIALGQWAVVSGTDFPVSDFGDDVSRVGHADFDEAGAARQRPFPGALQVLYDASKEELRCCAG